MCVCIYVYDVLCAGKYSYAVNTVTVNSCTVFLQSITTMIKLTSI